MTLALSHPASDVGLAILAPRTTELHAAVRIEQAKHRIARGVGVDARLIGARFDEPFTDILEAQVFPDEVELPARFTRGPAIESTCHFPVEDAPPWRVGMLRTGHDGTCLPVPGERAA